MEEWQIKDIIPDAVLYRLRSDARSSKYAGGGSPPAYAWA